MRAPAKAWQSYRQVATQTASPGQLVLLLYNGIIRFLEQARLGFAHDDPKNFHEAINNDLNTAQALASTLEMVAEGYRRQDHHIWNTLKLFDSVIGLNLEERMQETRSAEFPPEVVRLSEESPDPSIATVAAAAVGTRILFR